MVKKSEDEKYLEKFKENVDQMMDDLLEATENWPYPPGEKYRELAKQHRKTQEEIIASVLEDYRLRTKNK